METCTQCSQECEEVYQVKVIDEVGKLSYEKTCSEQCATEIQDELYHLHKNRAEDVYNQVIQRIK